MPKFVILIHLHQMALLNLNAHFQRLMSLLRLPEDPLFYCKLVDNQSLRLNRGHQYYQVHLQLYTSLAPWCDFCEYTTKSIAVERIYPVNNNKSGYQGWMLIFMNVCYQRLYVPRQGRVISYNLYCALLVYCDDEVHCKVNFIYLCTL